MDERFGQSELVTGSLIFTTEPLATRALAAEIRHDPRRFIQSVSKLGGPTVLGTVVDVSAEKSAEKIDVAVTFADPTFVLGVEAKFDHELTEDQVRRELSVANHLVVLLLDRSHAPLWLADEPRVTVMTWEEALDCFEGSRLTLGEVRAARSGKAGVEAKLRGLVAVANTRLGDGWTVDDRRGGAGMPAVNFYSPSIGDRQLRAVLQVAGRAMPQPGEPIRVRFSVGTRVVADEACYPSDAANAPYWVAPLHRLRDVVLRGRPEEFRLSTRRPSSGRAKADTANGRAHARKLAIVDRWFDPGDRWLTTGYINWIVGPASVSVPLEDVEVLLHSLLSILEGWYRIEAEERGGRC